MTEMVMARMGVGWAARAGTRAVTRRRSRRAAGARADAKPADCGIHSQLQILVECISERLELEPGDRVVDLGCGSGLVTSQIARGCGQVLGLETSKALVEAARDRHAAANVEYRQVARGGLKGLAGALQSGYSKAVCYHPLAYLDCDSFESLLDDILALCGSEPVVLLTNAMERRRFRGPLRRLSRGILRALHLARGGRSVALRHPWRLREVRNACRARGLEVQVLPQDPRLSTAHHRVDLLIRRAPDAAA